MRSGRLTDSPRDPRFPRVLPLSLSRCASRGLLATLLVLGASVYPGVVGGECIDYGDYAHWVSRVVTPGTASDVAVSGAYAYIANRETGLLVIDISNPQSPRLVGSIDTPGSAYAVAVSGTYVYIADLDHGLQIVDVHDPTNPVLAGNADTPGSAVGVAVAGTFAYVADGGAGLQVIDVANPATPQLLGGADTPDFAQDLAVAGNHVYVADGSSGLQVVDVSVPGDPQVVGSLNTPGSGYGVALTGSYALLADGPGGLQVIDVAIPASPRLVTSMSPVRSGPSKVAVSGQHAYVVDYFLQIVDIGVPEIPQLVGSVATAGQMVAVDVAGNYAYGVDAQIELIIDVTGLNVMDIASPETPQVAGAIDTPGFSRRLAVSGPHAFVADEQAGLQVVDWADPENPRIVGSVDTPGYARDVAVAGGYAYVADSQWGLQTIDVTNPLSPRIVGSVDTPGAALGVDIEGALAFVADDAGGLQVIDISNPLSPSIVGHVTPPYPGFRDLVDVDVEGAIAYAVSSTFLFCIDVSSPAHPVVVGSVDTAGFASGLSVSGGHAYVADRGLYVIDVADPENPRWTEGMWLVEWGGGDVAVDGEYAYVVDVAFGLHVLDISEADAPRRVGGAQTPLRASGVVVSGEWVCIANGYAGFQTIPGHCEVTPTQNTVGPETSPRCISTANPCASAPVRIERTDALPMRGYSVELALSPELALCGPGITQGSYLSSVGTTVFHVNGTNPYTVDCAILGLPCGATAPTGTLFDVAVTGTVPEGTGTITVSAVTLRDCGNVGVPAATGAAAPIAIDTVAPAAVADLVVTQVKTGNDEDGTTKVSLDFTLPTDADSVFVWRKGYGGYPEYDDSGGSVPVVPAGFPPAGWDSVFAGESYAGLDQPAIRDVWYYLVYAKDGCGNLSVASNRGGGCLNYHLGDVSDGRTEGVGDNDVGMADVSLLGDHYRQSPFPVAYNYLDVGPTADHSVNGRPTTDDRIDFEDLMMFAINYGQVGLMGDEPVVVDGANREPRLVLETEATAEGFVARLVLMENEGVVKGIAARLDVGGMLEVIAVEEGALLGAQAAPVFFERVGDGIDCAVLGAGEVLRGSGEVAVFRLRGRGTVTLTAADLRDVRNRIVGAVAAGVEPAAAPLAAEFALLAARPNPFNPSTTLTFRLPEGSRATLAIYDVTGALVRRLVDGELGAGEHVAYWDGRSDRGQAVGSGVYVARLEAAGHELTQKLQLLK